MGRWAYFSTGLEYKFSFASQESSDILEFGGVHSGFQRLNDEDYLYIPTEVTWTDAELPAIDEILKEMEKEQGLMRPSFDTFPFNKEGTEKLYSYYCEKERQSTNDKYVLGLLIYHQLQYESPLEVNFEW